MDGIFETKLLKYKKHIIQVFEDMFGQRYVYIDGKTQTYSINNAKRMISLCCFSLEELRGFVGGHIELVRLSKSQVMVVNEEGKVYDLPQNENATMLVNIAGIRDVIVGNVLVCDINKIK